MDASPDHPDSPPLADAGLRCPKCEYNLTGLAEDRCPECGEAFDRKQLRRLAAGEPGPIPGWDNVPNPVIAFVGTCLRTWFAPIATGRTFPSIHNPKSLNRFRAAVLGISLCTFLLICMLGSRGIEGIALVIAVSVGVSLCERWTRDVLGLCFGKGPGCKEKTDAWSGLVGLHRSFLLVTSVTVPPVAVIFFGQGTLLIFLTAVAWWSLSLTLSAASRGYKVWRAAGAVLLLWVAAAASTITAYFGGMIVGGLIVEVLRHVF